MVETTQFAFDLQEAATALIKQQGIHEGLWMIGFEIGMAAGIMGPNQTDAKPGAMLQINKVQLVRATVGSDAFPFIVDAAVVNPRPGAPVKKTEKASRRRL
jgi:hypothetical protein